MQNKEIAQDWTLNPDNTLAQNILDFSGYVYNQLPTNPTLQNQIVKGAVFKMSVDQSILDTKKSLIDIASEIDMFVIVKNRRSFKTKTTYKHILHKFLDYLNDKSLDFLYLTIGDVDTWLNYQNSIHSPRTVRNNLATLSSFYQHLMTRNPDTFSVNPFYKRDLPRIRNKHKHDQLTNSDLETILGYFREIDRHDMALVITLLDKYGWRSGIFEDMTINTTTKTFSSVTKNHDIHGKLTQDEIAVIFKHNLLGSKQNKWADMMIRHMKILHSRGLLSNKPSLHDIRRKYIKQGVKE